MMRVTTMTLAALLGLAAVEAYSQGVAPAATAMTPSQAQMRSKLARAYQLKEKSKPLQAIAAFKTVLKTDPGNSEAIVELGYLYAGMKQWPAAAKYFKQAVDQDPGNMRLRMDLAYARAGMRNFSGAAEEFRVVANEPGEFQQRAKEALDAMGAEAQAGANAGHRKTVSEGWAALRRGDRPTARRKFEAALKADPKDAAVLKQVGFLDLQDGRMPEAVKKFEMARELDSSDYFIALQLGYLYERMNKKEEARGAFTAAMSSPDEKIRAAAKAALAPVAPAAPSIPASAPAERAL